MTTNTNTDLRGKVVLVTGAGSGLGEATARAFAQEGCAVACVDVDRAAAERVSGALAKGDTPSMAFACDVSDETSVFATVKAVAEKMGRLDIIVNDAAIDHTVSVEEMTVSQWDKVIAVNLRGPFLFARAAFPLLREQGGGHIVNIASTAPLRDLNVLTSPFVLMRAVAFGAALLAALVAPSGASWDAGT